MTTIKQAMDRAIDSGVTVYNDVMISSRKDRTPDTLTFTVRKGDNSVLCTRIKGTLNKWSVSGMGYDVRTYTGRGFVIMVAIGMVTGSNVSV